MFFLPILFKQNAKYAPRLAEKDYATNKYGGEFRLNIAIESLIAQVADSYAEAHNTSVTEALRFFMTTKTFALLINPKSYLHLETAPYVEDMLDAELSGDWDSWMEV